jgi:hypothetical protein
MYRKGGKSRVGAPERYQIEKKGALLQRMSICLLVGKLQGLQENSPIFSWLEENKKKYWGQKIQICFLNQKLQLNYKEISAMKSAATTKENVRCSLMEGSAECKDLCQSKKCPYGYPKNSCPPIRQRLGHVSVQPTSAKGHRTSARA